MTDPLAPLAAMPAVADAAAAAREALGKVHRHPANRREWGAAATESSLRGARASAALDGGVVDLSRDADVDDPVFAGAMRVAQAIDTPALDGTVGVWRRAPLQVLARLHTLAAADLVDDPEQLGRPRPGAGDRLALLSQLVTGGTSVAAPVLAAVVHGEILSLRPFGTADGVVARAASRLVTVASGLDPHALGIPETTWLKFASGYASAADAFGTGSEDGVVAWVTLCCSALEAGAREGLAIAER
ncbi:oxidoreductase [Tsukamurella sp. 8F]|uniref:oxidoreductase n=1 Tax=unclassified Tsukamurella TaxID=2633480 RepID=UPI0023B990C1|nr:MULTISPECIES: oxidoreductase [unclassified Tsukamurella]MDF0529591.1 oxidoreductase [Tsukamurella sp. 8J]MDF0585721.1 oxidoreductase [Tsukamurella sp. 8F]